jgi:hypothetical protein
VYIGDVVPDDDGAVLLNFSTTQAAAYAFHAGIMIEDYTDVHGGSVNSSVLEQTGPDLFTIDSLRAGNIYPNPFTDGINIELNNSSRNNRVIAEIFDVAGRSVYRTGFSNVGEGNNILRVNPASVDLKAGVYIIMVKINGQIVQSSKLVKTSK